MLHFIRLLYSSYNHFYNFGLRLEEQLSCKVNLASSMLELFHQIQKIQNRGTMPLSNAWIILKLSGSENIQAKINVFIIWPLAKIFSVLQIGHFIFTIELLLNL